MANSLDISFKSWLSSVSEAWEVPITQVAQSIGADEIHHRLQYYPIVHRALDNITSDPRDFVLAVRSCWSLGGQFNATRLNRFLDQREPSVRLIWQLIDQFPGQETDMAERIDYFVSRSVTLGYQTPTGGSDWSGAALLASTILTAYFPQLFVDYRTARWKKFATTVNYDCTPLSGSSYGRKLIWAGQLAKEVSETETFGKYWDTKYSLWIIAGLSWVDISPKKPDPDPIDIDSVESFPEGRKKRILHLARERSQTVVARAKALGLCNDPLLRCEVCGFSFVERYGDIGKGFIEAHHLQPVASLRPGSRTKVEDIGLICANCHRMIHKGDKTLSLAELREKLRR